MADEPLIPLKPGENYRFHFDATKCIGCKCCEVACHEQNNNPPAVKWRQVGEIEGGEFPQTKRFYISMACNHCLDPSCLTGCPVDAYTKDEKTGIVRMKEDACIGCQYCTWNCPYGAPQFNKERGMVTKCDMCHGRIEQGQNPACVEACPSGALEIERFNVEEWTISQANAPGVPDAAITRSTTRITPPKKNGFDLKRIDDYRLQPEQPHYSLVLLTVLTQLAVGGFGSLLILEWLNYFKSLPEFFGRFLNIAHLAMLGTVLLALNASFFHLGRPLHAVRALKMWRRSWLSREVLFFSLFAGSAMAYSLLGWQKIYPLVFPVRGLFGILVALFGLTGVYCSAMIYRVPARPSWDSWRTPVAFLATAFILGPLLALAVFFWSLKSQILAWDEVLPTIKTAGLFLTSILLLAGFVQLGGIAVKVFHSLNEGEPELKASARMLTRRFRTIFLWRLGVLLLTLLLIPLVLVNLALGESLEIAPLAVGLTGLAILATGSEMVGRYLFFVTVVPKKRPAGYF
ncbi:MAG: dimethyl sulfoxide reductase anchor subunit [Deltaproteobacteria bacterium]|nr:dimethyl sulfoxide reductase anchor subunit [Deltaproteobacteria bacterium]